MSEEMRAASSVEDADLQTAAIPLGLTVGQQLRAAREAKNFSVLDVAQVLKISPRQVAALESDDWASLPGNTIIRGFIRNYARLLDLDADAFMHALDVAQMPQPPKLDIPAGTRATLPEQGRAGRRDLATVFSGLILVVLALLAYFFVPQDFWQSRLTELAAAHNAPEVVAEKAEPPASAAVPESTAQSAALAVPAATVPSVAPAEAPVQPPSVPSSAIATSGGLKLSFAQAAWVEIRDGSGQIIFSQLNPAGTQRDVEGLPPFALVIGNATNVTVQYKGKVVELSQRSKDDVARLTLE